MEYYDILLFCDIIETEGVRLMWVDRQEINGKVEVVHWYHGTNGRRVPICTTDEFMTITIAKQHLAQVGLVDLVHRMFPN